MDTKQCDKESLVIINKVVLIVIWYGEVPSNFEVWSRSAEYLKSRYDFLIFSDTDFSEQYIPENVIIYKTSMENLKQRIEIRLGVFISVRDPKRFCDFRPLFGYIFHDKIAGYSFWGHTDLDVIWGNMERIVNDSLLSEIDVLLNGGHFSIYRNTEKINKLYTHAGAVFPWRTIISRDAQFAFDEVTGIHLIAKKYNIQSAIGTVDMVDVNPAHFRFSNKMEKTNPKCQAFYFEQGNLYRVRMEDKLEYQSLCYIHIPKRKLKILDDELGDAFRITPYGYIKKKNLGWPTKDELHVMNPFHGDDVDKREKRKYYFNKAIEIAKRNPY